MARRKKKQRKNPPTGKNARRGKIAAAGRGHRPSTADPDVGKAIRAWERRDFDRAISLYERALKRDPGNPVLLVDVARAYALRFRFVDAELLIERAFRRYPDDAQLQIMLGRSFEQLQQFDRAIACFRRALELQPDSRQRAGILLQLAMMHERLHDLDSAEEFLEEALQLNPNLVKANLTLAVIERRTGRTNEAVVRLKAIVEQGQGDAEPEVIARSLYQIAAIQDQRGQYNESYASLTEGKQVLEKISAPYRYDADQITRSARRMIRAVTSDHFQRWKADGNRLKALPSGIAFLTSHPRSGTTLLEQALDSHPQLISADELQVFTELVFIPLGRFDDGVKSPPDVLDAAPLEMLTRLRSDYRTAVEGALREPIGERLLLDKNPEFTMMLPTICRAFPEVKVVFALRDPRDVVVSCFAQWLPLNPVSVHFLTLEKTVKKYATMMSAWLKLRDMMPNPWIEVRYEDAVDDLPKVAQGVLEFLGLPWDNAVLDYRQRAQQKHVHSPTYEAVTKPVYRSSVGRWRNYERQLEPYLEQLKPFIEAFGYDQ